MPAEMVIKDDMEKFKRTGEKFIKEWEVRGANPAIRWKEIRNKYRQGLNFL